mmetsp:Transcript_60440/g.74082  ORF Transcript_60440/g.74082 Transcript_60440/m.74082 type:complete len:184 (-) Transcript_60440:60-611(-)
MGTQSSKKSPEYPPKISIEIRKKSKHSRTLIYSKITDNFMIYDALLGHELENTYIQTKPKKQKTILFHDNERDCWFTTAIHNITSKPRIEFDIYTNSGDNKRVMYLKTYKPKILTLLDPNKIIVQNTKTTIKDLTTIYTWNNYKYWGTDVDNEMYIIKQLKDKKKCEKNPSPSHLSNDKHDSG